MRTISDNVSLAVDLIRRNIAPRHVDLRLYLDILPDFSPAGCSSHITSEKIQLGGAGTIIFLKHFDPTRQTLFGIDKICMPGANRVSDLIPIIKERMKWRSETQLKLYEVTACAFSPTRRANAHPSPGNQTWHD